ncbi:MAG TPA: ABC transporter permease [Limnochordales bacterium]|nr:ABC transporter permease [Limnochordales bacterium]
MAAEIQRSPSNGTAPETANGTNNRAAAGFAAIWHARWMRRFRRDRMAVGGVIFVVLLIFVAVLAPWLAPYDPAEQHILYRLRGPNEMFRLGTDEFGRDVLSRLIYGSRASLVVGLASVFLAGVLGTVIGGISGYMGGRVDQIISSVTNILMSFPSLLLGLMVVVALGPGTTNVVIAVALSLLPNFIRLARGPVLALREKEFVQACRAIGVSEARIILRHIIPNILGPISVMSTLWIATAIRTEASLSFLGLGVQPPTPSWGNMIRSGVNNILSNPWLAVFSGLAITVTVLAFNVIGDGLRDALDPKQRP